METTVAGVLAFGADSETGIPGGGRQHRQIRFNGKPLTWEQQEHLEELERSLGVRLPDRDYWCDLLEL